MWTSLVSTATLPPLASLSRVFLGPIIPGWIDPSGQVRLPLKMEPAEVSLGIRHDDTRGLRTWHAKNDAYFASRFPELGLFGSEAEFQREMRPAWLANAASRIRTTIETYASGISPSSSLSPIAHVLEERGGSLHDLLSACLYLGPGCQDYCLIPQDLTLYGEELKDEDGLYGLLRLIESTAHVDLLIGSGMTDIISIADDAKIRRLHDAVAGRTRQQELRPNCFYEADDAGHIHPLRPSEAMVHSDYDVFQSALVRENKILLGCFLFAELGLDEKDFFCLLRMLSSNLDGLNGDRATDSVLKYLGPDSAIRGPEETAMARFLATAIRETNDAPQRD